MKLDCFLLNSIDRKLSVMVTFFFPQLQTCKPHLLPSVCTEHLVSSLLRKIWSPMAHQVEIWCHLYRQSTLSSWEQLLEEPELGETCQCLKLTFQIQMLRLQWQSPSSWWNGKVLHIGVKGAILEIVAALHTHTHTKLYSDWVLLVNHSGLFSALQLLNQKFRVRRVSDSCKKD